MERDAGALAVHAFTMAVVVVAFATKESPIPIRSPLTVMQQWCISSANGSRAPSHFAKRRASWWEQERRVWRTRGTRSFPRLVTLSLSLLAASSAASCFLSSVSFPFASYTPLCLSLSLSLSPRRLSTPSPLPPLAASRTCEIHRAGFPCDAVSPASSLQPRYYLDFHRPEMPSFYSPLFVVCPSSLLSARREPRPRALVSPRDFCSKRIPARPPFFHRTARFWIRARRRRTNAIVPIFAKSRLQFVARSWYSNLDNALQINL